MGASKFADPDAGKVFESLTKAEQDRRGIWPDRFKCDCCLGEHEWRYLYADHISQLAGQPNKLPWCYYCCNLKPAARKKQRLDARQEGVRKICNTCHKEKNIILFGLDGRNKDGRQGRCQDCVQEKRMYANMRDPGRAEKERERVRAWKKANPDKVKESRRKRARALKAKAAYSNWREQCVTLSPT